MVAVVADSAANLPGDMARELGIEVVAEQGLEALLGG